MPDKKACPGGGIVKVEEGCHKSNQGSVSLYLFVDDLGKYIKVSLCLLPPYSHQIVPSSQWLIVQPPWQKIEVAGGKKMDEVEPEGDMGLMQHFEDTEGNYFGLYALQKKDK